LQLCFHFLHAHLCAMVETTTALTQIAPSTIRRQPTNCPVSRSSIESFCNSTHSNTGSGSGVFAAQSAQEHLYDVEDYPNLKPENMFLGTTDFPAMCIPLLKFEGNYPSFSNNGLDALSSLQSNICVIAFIGDGRSGKSWLANQYVHLRQPFLRDGATVFTTASTGEPVTDGIDMYILPPDLLGQSTVILDCEGGNNPATTVKNFVNVMAMRFANLVVDVSYSRFTEAQLQHIAYAITVRDHMLPVDATNKLPTQNLLLVANDCNLKYTHETLSSMIDLNRKRSPTSQEAIVTMSETFSQIKHHVVRSPWTTSCGARDLAAAIDPMRLPTKVDDVDLTGRQLAALFRQVKEAWEPASRVDPPSILRHVVFDNYLMPAVDKHVIQFNSSLPSDGEYVSQIEKRDNRNMYIDRFERGAEHIKRRDLVTEARTIMQGKLSISWDTTVQANDILGLKPKEVLQVEKERLVRTSAREDGSYRAFLLFYRKRTQKLEHYQNYVQSTTVRHNGTRDTDEWFAVGQTVEKEAGHDFEPLCVLQ